MLFLKRKCPCCGCKTLNTENNSLYEICPICFWKYDPIKTTRPTGGLL
nr:CPCC family cysteine-rich protein [Ruminococcus bromii]